MSDEELRRARRSIAGGGSAGRLLQQEEARIRNAPPPSSRAGAALPANPSDTRNVLWRNPETGEEEARTVPTGVALAGIDRGTARDASSGETARLFEALTRRDQIQFEEVSGRYSFAEGVGESMLGGLTGGLHRAALWSEEDRALFAEWNKANPWAAGLGEAFGFLAPLMFTGGLSGVAAVGAKGTIAATGRMAMASSSAKRVLRAYARYGTAGGLSESAARGLGTIAQRKGLSFLGSQTGRQVMEGLASALPGALLAEMNEAETDYGRFGRNLAIYGGVGAFVPVAIAGVKAARGQPVTGAKKILDEGAGDATLSGAQARVDMVPPEPAMMEAHRDALLKLVDEGDADGVINYLQRVAADEGPNDALAARTLLKNARDRLFGGPRSWFDSTLDDIRGGAGGESQKMVDDLTDRVLRPLIEGASQARGFGRGAEKGSAVGVAGIVADPTTKLGKEIDLNPAQLKQGYYDYANQRLENILDQFNNRAGGVDNGTLLRDLRELVGDDIPMLSAKGRANLPAEAFTQPAYVGTRNAEFIIDVPALQAKVRQHAEDGFQRGETGRPGLRQTRRLVVDEIDYENVRLKGASDEGEFVDFSTQIEIPLASVGTEPRSGLTAKLVSGNMPGDVKRAGQWVVKLPPGVRRQTKRATGREVSEVVIEGARGGRDAMGFVPGAGAGGPRRAGRSARFGGLREEEVLLPTPEAIREAFDGIVFGRVQKGTGKVADPKGKAFEDALHLGGDLRADNAGSAVYSSIELMSRNVPLGKAASETEMLAAKSVELSKQNQALVDSFRDSPEIFGEAFTKDAAVARDAYTRLISSLGNTPSTPITNYIKGTNPGDDLNKVVGDFLFGTSNTPPKGQELMKWIGEVASSTARLAAVRGTEGTGYGMKYLKDAFEVLGRRRAQLETLEAANRLSFKARRETTQESWGAAVGRAFLGLPGVAAQSLLPWQVRAFLNSGPLRSLQSLAGDKAFEQVGRFAGGKGTNVRVRTAQNIADERMRAFGATDIANESAKGDRYFSVSQVRARLPVPGTVMGIRTGGRRLWDSWDEDPTFEDRWRQLNESVTEVGGSPQGMLLGMGLLTEPLYEADPTGEMAGAYGDATAQAFSYLAEVMPTGSTNPLTGEEEAPAASECREWLSAADALADPAAAMGEMVATGLVRQSAVEAVRACYPELFAQLTMAFVEGVAELGDEVTYSKKMTLWHATGLELDPTMTDGFVAASASNFSQTPAQSQALGQPAAMQAQGFAQAAARMPVQKTMQSVENMTGLQGLEQKGIG